MTDAKAVLERLRKTARTDAMNTARVTGHEVAALESLLEERDQLKVELQREKLAHDGSVVLLESLLQPLRAELKQARDYRDALTASGLILLEERDRLEKERDEALEREAFAEASEHVEAPNMSPERVEKSGKLRHEAPDSWATCAHGRTGYCKTCMNESGVALKPAERTFTEAEVRTAVDKERCFVEGGSPVVPIRRLFAALGLSEG